MSPHNMPAELTHISDQQGWDWNSLTTVILDFIRQRDLTDDLVAFASRAAKAENGDPYIVVVRHPGAEGFEFFEATLSDSLDEDKIEATLRYLFNENVEPLDPEAAFFAYDDIGIAVDKGTEVDENATADFDQIEISDLPNGFLAANDVLNTLGVIEQPA